MGMHEWVQGLQGTFQQAQSQERQAREEHTFLSTEESQQTLMGSHVIKALQVAAYTTGCMPLPDPVNSLLASACHVNVPHTLLGCREAAVMRCDALRCAVLCCAVLCCAVLCCSGLNPAMLSVDAAEAAADAAGCLCAEMGMLCVPFKLRDAESVTAESSVKW